eukprot:Amastigsp_a4574_54.p4 type:complete len:119 gc:universal Amastigsp_a4574_54:753-397(-)
MAVSCAVYAAMIKTETQVHPTENIRAGNDTRSFSSVVVRHDQQYQMPSLTPRKILCGKPRGCALCSRNQTKMPEMNTETAMTAQSCHVNGLSTRSRSISVLGRETRTSRPVLKYVGEK